MDKIAVEDMRFEQVDGDEIFVVRVRPFKRETQRCPKCGKRCQGYDSKEKLRRWRSLDFGSQKVYIEATSPRVKCPEHGVIVARVPWAKHDFAYTNDFETAVTWFALHATATDVSDYFRIKWDTVGSITRRVQLALEEKLPSRFDGLVEIGIDETSYKKGHKYMTVVVDHRTGNLIWAHKGFGKDTLTLFFKELSEEQRASIKVVTADGARWIADCVKDYCPNAQRCIDPFHVVSWATTCLDDIRKATVKSAQIAAAEGARAVGGKKNERRANHQRVPTSTRY